MIGSQVLRSAMEKMKAEDSRGGIACESVCVQSGTEEESDSLPFGAAPGQVRRIQRSRKPGIALAH